MDSYVIERDWKTNPGYRAVVVRNIGAFDYRCGYVGIPKKHVLYGKSYGENILELHSMWEQAMKGPVGKRGMMPFICHEFLRNITMDIVFDVHGSVTYSETDGEFPVDSDLHWIGFDCNHVGDTPKKCTLDYCISECENLAKQLKEVG